MALGARVILIELPAHLVPQLILRIQACIPVRACRRQGEQIGKQIQTQKTSLLLAQISGFSSRNLLEVQQPLIRFLGGGGDGGGGVTD